MCKVAIVGNGTIRKAVLRQLKDTNYEDAEVVSTFEEFDKLVKDMSFKDKLSPIEEYIQAINNSTKQLRFDTPAQNCKKNFKRNKLFNI